MTPADLQDGEVQYYASPVLIKTNRFYATLTNLRLIIEGSNTRDFKVASIRGAFPENLGGTEPGVKISISTPSGHKDMILTFPLDEKYKAAEQQAWIDAITKAVGDKPFATGPAQPIAESSLKFNEATPKPVAETAIAVAAVQPELQEPTAPGDQQNSIEFIRGETVAISTAGVRVKHTFYTAYLTNLRLILQNNLGKIGREFAIAELVDAASIESESGEPEIAISIGVQGGLKQMIIIYPTTLSRDGWMQQLQNKLARKSVPQQHSPAVAARIGTFVPATNERIIVTTPNVRVKNRPVIVHLTSTRFIVDSTSGIIGDFAVSSILRFSRMASEIGEPGISVILGGSTGEREMHLVFANINDRESWMDALVKTVPENQTAQVQPETPYSVTTVMPKPPVNPQTMRCPNCGATNPVSEERCGMCGSLLRQPKSASADGYEEDESEWPPKNYKRSRKERKERKQREPKDEWSSRKYNRERREYTGGVVGFITRPSDAFNYYAHESPAGPFPVFLVTGAIWALLTSIIIVYILPKILTLDETQFPIFDALDGNFLLLIIVAILLWFIWIIAQLLQATITSVIAHLFEPSVRISEVVAITMRSSLTYAAVGWIPIFGLFGAGIWAAVDTVVGLKTTQDTPTAGSVIATAVGLIGVYVLLFFIGGGFS